MSVEIMTQPREFFREQIERAVSRQKLTLDQEIEFYLVNLLCDFIDPTKLKALTGDLDILDLPMALFMKKALEAPPEQRVKLFKSMGDTSLYIAGYFQDSFNRKSYDVEYYVALGSQAYGNVSDLLREQQGREAQPGTYSVLARRFHELVELVAEVSDLLHISRPKNLLSIYDRWTRNQSDRLRRQLEESGIQPVPLNTKMAN